jgi:hypothetical protein
MRIHDKCLPCVVNQVIKVANITGVDNKEELLREVFTYLSMMDFEATTPEIIGEIFEMIKKHTNNPDPYKETRNYYNTLFLNLLPKFECKIEQAENPFQLAVKYAIVSNIIDFNPIHNTLLEDIFDYFEEIEQFELKFNIIKHYGIKLLVARNKVEKEMLKAVKEQFKVFHISELNEDITFESVISNTKLNLKERRALMIFDMISRIFEKDHNMFAIGDVMVTKTVSLKNTEIKETVIDDEIVIIRDSKSDKVYVDRSIVDLSNISESLNETLILQDVQFILQNLKDICKSIRLLLSDITY